MRTTAFLFCFALLLGSVAPAFAQETVVRGTLRGHDGQPLPAAHAGLHAFGADRGPLRLTQAAADGTYRLALDTTGVFSLWLTGVNHHAEEVPLLIAGDGQTITIDARLATYRYGDDLSALQALGDFNNFSFGRGTAAMARQPDGTYAATVPAAGDSMAYQVINAQASRQRSINGTMTDRYVYDRGGDYQSVVAAPGDSVTLVFDPDAVVEDLTTEAQITFGDEDSAARQYAAFADTLAARQQAFLQNQRRQRAAPSEEQTPLEPADAGGDAFARTYPFLHRALTEAGPDSTLRAALYLTYVGAYRTPLGGLSETGDALLAQRILREVPPTSPLWGVLSPRAARRGGRGRHRRIRHLPG